MEKDSDIKSLNSMKIFQPETTVQCRNSNKYTKLLQEEISFDAFFILRAIITQEARPYLIMIFFQCALFHIQVI